MLKPGGQMAVFWTNYPNNAYDIFDMAEHTANNTQAAIWGHDKQLQFTSIELTGSYRLFWHRVLSELKVMEQELKAEVPEHYKALMDECIYFNGLIENGDAGGLFRWLFVFNKTTLE
jgi:hypothetical protein